MPRVVSKPLLPHSMPRAPCSMRDSPGPPKAWSSAEETEGTRQKTWAGQKKQRAPF